MLQQDTEKIVPQNIEHDIVNVHKQLRASKRDIVANLCLDLKKTEITEISDYHDLLQEYYARLGKLAVFMLLKENIQEYGLKQFIQRLLFDLRYDSLVSSLLDRIAR